ncbi:MAG: MoxR family ATPase [Pseudomonadales bacterium]|nr:MoxR family ATPase [Pseudomonadales bacterium]MCP5184481.1 MoxR family ATPase [Pseudomonadales bacterium]
MNTQAQDLKAHMEGQLRRVMFGLDDAMHALTIAFIARGHVLLEGPPGLGKTLLGRHYAQVLGGSFGRIQGTADLMPTDITGVHVYNAAAAAFEFQPGPVFNDVLLVDEINRTGPKTQSALLEAMEERQVSVDREAFALADDFLVVATQNPSEFEGTYPLPESQLDRFLVSVPLTYPNAADELRILAAYNLPDAQLRREPVPLDTVDRALISAARQDVANVQVADSLYAYVLDLATATRQSSRISLGLSTRAALAVVRCARVEAALRGGEFVIPDDVKRVFPWVARHRLSLSPDTILDGIVVDDELRRLLDTVAVPH